MSVVLLPSNIHCHCAFSRSNRIHSICQPISVQPNFITFPCNLHPSRIANNTTEIQSVIITDNNAARNYLCLGKMVSAFSN